MSAVAVYSAKQATVVMGSLMMVITGKRKDQNEPQNGTAARSFTDTHVKDSSNSSNTSNQRVLQGKVFRIH